MWVYVYVYILCIYTYNTFICIHPQNYDATSAKVAVTKAREFASHILQLVENQDSQLRGELKTTLLQLMNTVANFFSCHVFAARNNRTFFFFHTVETRMCDMTHVTCEICK